MRRKRQWEQDFGLKSQDRRRSGRLNSNHNNKNTFSNALPLAEPLASHNGGSAAFG
jgi:hypothetical protein